MKSERSNRKTKKSKMSNSAAAEAEWRGNYQISSEQVSFSDAFSNFHLHPESLLLQVFYAIRSRSGNTWNYYLRKRFECKIGIDSW